MSAIARFTALIQERTKNMKTEVIIAERNEPDLANTVANIRENNDCTVRVVSDTEGRGPQAMRHKGIMESDADVVIIMDGHMRTLPRRLDAAAEYIGARGRKVACLKCFHSEQEQWVENMYGGARLVWQDYGKDHKDPQAFVAKWRKSTESGRIGCVMGACYVFRRDWYIDGLREPWKHGTGWGCDEELISAATWLRGGEVELLPWAVWHQARKAGTQPFSYTERQLYGVWANRLRLLQVLPMPQEQRNDLLRHLMSAMSSGRWVKIAKICDETAKWQEQYRAFLGAGGLSWDEFSTQIMEKETVKKPSMMELREQAKAAGIIVPFGCKKADLMDMLSKTPENPAIIPKREKKPPIVDHEDGCPKGAKDRPSRANWGPCEANMLHKRECPHCGSLSTEVVGIRHVGRLTMRQRKCLDTGCLKPFPTREATPRGE